MVVCVAIHKDQEYAPYAQMIEVYFSKTDSYKTKPVRVRVLLCDFTFDLSVYVYGTSHLLGWSGSVELKININKFVKLRGLILYYGRI